MLIACAFLVPFLCEGAPSKDSPGGKFSVVYSPKSNVIRVEASDADLLALVEDMARNAGFRILGSAPPDIRVSIRKANRLDRMLFELLDRGGISFLFLYDNLKTGKVAEVVILGTGDPKRKPYIPPANVPAPVQDPGKSGVEDAGDEIVVETEGE